MWVICAHPGSNMLSLNSRPIYPTFTHTAKVSIIESPLQLGTHKIAICLSQSQSRAGDRAQNLPPASVFGFAYTASDMGFRWTSTGHVLAVSGLRTPKAMPASFSYSYCALDVLGLCRVCHDRDEPMELLCDGQGAPAARRRNEDLGGTIVLFVTDHVLI